MKNRLRIAHNPLKTANVRYSASSGELWSNCGKSLNYQGELSPWHYCHTADHYIQRTYRPAHPVGCAVPLSGTWAPSPNGELS